MTIRDISWWSGKKPPFQNLLFICMKISLAKSAVEVLRPFLEGCLLETLSSLKLLTNASGLILCAALNWVTPEADSETRIWVQVIHLGSNLKKYWYWGRKVMQRRVTNMGCVIKSVTPVCNWASVPLETDEWWMNEWMNIRVNDSNCQCEWLELDQVRGWIPCLDQHRMGEGKELRGKNCHMGWDAVKSGVWWWQEFRGCQGEVTLRRHSRGVSPIL